MSDSILGLHHITAIAGPAKRNYDFYTKVMGLRFVKKTVNFDDPGTYHFYYGNEQGAPGTILTFFPWEHVKQGHIGTGMATEIAYSVPRGSLEQWNERLREAGVRVEPVEQRFGDNLLPFRDPDGLNLSLVEGSDERTPWTAGIDRSLATRGFQGVTLTLRNTEPTVKILTDIFGYTFERQECKRSRYVTDSVTTANVVDVLESPTGLVGQVAGGTNHHVAFRVKDEETLMRFREKVATAGHHITEKIDRNYFYSLYFREPGGVLFEIATDNPGFTVDEPADTLGKALKLPAQYESKRDAIEKHLPVIG